MAYIVNEKGHKYGRLTVLEYSGLAKSGEAEWKCECECGAVCFVAGSKLRRGITRSCGCLRRETMRVNRQIVGSKRAKDETGNRYGKLVVMRMAGKSAHQQAKWVCRCDCGNYIEVAGNSLRTGNTKSCGRCRLEECDEKK